MTVTGRHQQDLAEIRALAGALSRSIQEVRERIGEARDEVASERPLLAFVHIPKTAGATATSMLAGAYSKAAVHDAGNYVRGPETTARKVAKRAGGWERWQRAGGRVTVGHVPYGLFREHLPPDARYMTFLREPVDRVLSQYYRHIHHPQMSRADRIKGQRAGRATAASLREALVEMRIPQLSNLATRFLCGHHSPMGELPASALDDAKANLREFAFVGIQERFEESIVLLQRTLGLDLVPYLNRHVSVDRPAAEEIPDEERALIEECNGFDAELYAFAMGLFEAAFPASDEGFAADVETVRALSAELNEEATGKARDWLDRELPAGATRSAEALRLAAQTAGVSIPAFKHVLGLSSLTDHDHDGQKIVTRTEETNGDHMVRPEAGQGG